MTEEEKKEKDRKKKQRIAEMIHDLSLYPSRAWGENLVRFIFCVVSWFIIRYQGTDDLKVLGASYLIFVIPLFLDFIFEERNSPLGTRLMRIPVLLLGGMLTMAVLLLVVSSPDAAKKIYYWLSRCGPILIFIFGVCELLDVFQVHELVYDDTTPAKARADREAEEKRKTEEENQAERERIEAYFIGTRKGGEES